MKQLFLWIKPSPFGSTQVLAIPFLPGSVFISHQSFWHKELDLPTWFICSCFLDHENVASLFEVWRPWYQFKRWRMTFAFIRVPNYVLISGVGVEAMSSKAYYSAKRENGRHQMFFFFFYCTSLCLSERQHPELSEKTLKELGTEVSKNMGYSFVTMITHFEFWDWTLLPP